MAVPTGRESDKFMLRLPDGMRDRIKAAAEANGRSMNAEIVATLEEKYPVPFADEEFEKFLEVFSGMPYEERRAFIEAAIKRMGISDQDIADGLVPGLALRKG